MRQDCAGILLLCTMTLPAARFRNSEAMSRQPPLSPLFELSHSRKKKSLILLVVILLVSAYVLLRTVLERQDHKGKNVNGCAATYSPPHYCRRFPN